MMTKSKPLIPFADTMTSVIPAKNNIGRYFQANRFNTTFAPVDSFDLQIASEILFLYL